MMLSICIKLVPFLHIPEIRCTESFCAREFRLQVKADLLDQALCRLSAAASEDIAQDDKQNPIDHNIRSAAGASAASASRAGTSSAILLVAYKVHKVIVIHIRFPFPVLSLSCYILALW